MKSEQQKSASGEYFLYPYALLDRPAIDTEVKFIREDFYDVRTVEVIHLYLNLSSVKNFHLENCIFDLSGYSASAIRIILRIVLIPYASLPCEKPGSAERCVGLEKVLIKYLIGYAKRARSLRLRSVLVCQYVPSVTAVSTQTRLLLSFSIHGILPSFLHKRCTTR